MSKKYEKLAHDIVRKIGGSENVSTLTHCMTRLRFALNDNKKANRQGIEDLDGVISVRESGGQFQVVIGTHIEEVYEEVIKVLGNNRESSNQQKVGIFNKIIDFISGTFSPLVPAIAGAGMIKALLALLLLFNLVSRESQTYYVISFMSDASFYFLPFLLAFSAANKLKCSPVLAMISAGILLHPNFVQLQTAGENVHVLGIPLTLVSYSSSVVPILLIVWAQSYIEPMLKRIIPDAVKILFVPMFTVLLVGLIGLTVLGPLGSFFGQYLAMGFDFVGSQGSWLIIFLVATVWPILVMFGLHHSIVPLSLAQVTTLGYENILGPGAIISNIAQGVASLVVAWRTKDQSLKPIANSGGITSLMGITEPALYGVNLPKKYPLIATMIGGASGGLYAGLMEVSRYATGASGIPAIPLYIGENIWNLYNILIALVITVIVTAVATYLLSLKYEKNTLKQNENTKETKKVEDTPKENENRKETKMGTNRDTIITNPIKGNVVPLNEVTDDVFALETMGKGIAINPVEGTVVAPFNGEVVSLFPTKHAICLSSDDGVEMLIHVGINTVQLDGKYFESHVEQGKRISKGQTLLTFDLENIREEGYVTQVPIIILNTQDYTDVTTNCDGKIDYNDDLLVLKA
ncbi:MULTISPECIES: beta-glucoside-specific PTS transporter subunit IIABC [Priestia]|uniref:beta-glucoside-specific PTS transporter subunit IIABC n=1 Tax=Priestia TaxID=2800373 RepID=UPI00207AAD70|nr:beta-glucoside-specific PTS transporter subunit IIABC [Priestia megaterium]USL38035.1 beta-glucoside-specific PTS transporter subunit IIABC [Priestia megaterium]